MYAAAGGAAGGSVGGAVGGSVGGAVGGVVGGAVGGVTVGSVCGWSDPDGWVGSGVSVMGCSFQAGIASNCSLNIVFVCAVSAPMRVPELAESIAGGRREGAGLVGSGQQPGPAGLMVHSSSTSTVFALADATAVSRLAGPHTSPLTGFHAVLDARRYSGAYPTVRSMK